MYNVKPHSSSRIVPGEGDREAIGEDISLPLYLLGFSRLPNVGNLEIPFLSPLAKLLPALEAWARLLLRSSVEEDDGSL